MIVTRLRVGLLALALASGVAAGPLAQTAASAPGAPARPASALSFEIFKTQVQPIFLAQRAGAVRCVTCHVGAMAADLARYRDGAPVEAYRESLFERAARVAYRYRVPIGLVLAYMLMRVLLILALGR